MLGAQFLYFRRGVQEQIAVVLPHCLVAYGHYFAEHLARVVVEGDVVIIAFRHLLFAVEPNEQRHCDDRLPYDTPLALQIAAYEVVKELVGSAELDVGLHHDGVVPLHERVEKFHYGNRSFGGVPLGEVVAL